MKKIDKQLEFTGKYYRYWYSGSGMGWINRKIIHFGDKIQAEKLGMAV